MQKIIIDTNVLVSALIQHSYPHLILKAVFSEPAIEICISEVLFEEYLEVLNRDKFSRYPDFEANAQTLLLDIQKYVTTYTPNTHLNIISDKDDNKLLELAEKSRANFLITGNYSDFTMKKYKNTRIVTPKEYWEEILMKK